EKNYVPPVLDQSSSQSSLKQGQVLSQDAYGSFCSISVNGRNFPVPQLAVGRLVEIPAEISGMLDAYLETSGGVLPTPSSTLVTGYDFLADAAAAVEKELQLAVGTGAGQVHDSLIAPPTNAPELSWTASDLRT